MNSPDVFVRIMFNPDGSLQVDYFHASRTNIAVYSDYPQDGTVNEVDVLSTTRKYVRHSYPKGGSTCSDDDEQNEPSCSFAQPEDGRPPMGSASQGYPVGILLNSRMRLGAMLKRTDMLPTEMFWKAGGSSRTARSDYAQWGYFTLIPESLGNGDALPDLLVKIWFDVSGAVFVDFFNTGEMDLSAFSVFPESETYTQSGLSLPSNRYLRHNYQRQGADILVSLPAGLSISEASLYIPHAGTFGLVDTTQLSVGKLPMDAALLSALHQGVVVAMTLYEPGSGVIPVDCRQTALSHMISGNAGFLLPKAYIPDLKSLVDELPETGELATSLCAALAQNRKALVEVPASLDEVIKKAQAAARQRVLQLVE